MNNLRVLEILINKFLESKKIEENSELNLILENIFFSPKVEENLKLMNMGPIKSSNKLKLEHLFGSSGVHTKSKNENEDMHVNKRIMQIHANLKPIWEDIKKGLDGCRSGFYNRKKRITDLNFSMNFHSGVIDCGESQDKFKFLILLDKVPLNLFRCCKYKNCTNWFASQKSNQFFCSPKCTNKHRLEKYIKKNPEKHKNYHKEYQKKRYRKKCDDQRAIKLT